MQKKAEMLSHHVPDAIRSKMMDFPFRPREQIFYGNIFSLLLFQHLAWGTPNISCHLDFYPIDPLKYEFIFKWQQNFLKSSKKKGYFSPTIVGRKKVFKIRFRLF